MQSVNATTTEVDDWDTVHTQSHLVRALHYRGTYDPNYLSYKNKLELVRIGQCVFFLVFGPRDQGDGLPFALIAAKLGLGIHLHDLKNSVHERHLGML